ncbi:MAG: hypothetical protein ACR2M7_02350 [Bdellovibrionales bacterium]
MKLLLSLFFIGISSASQARLVEKTAAFVAEKAFLSSDIRQFQQQIKANLAPDSFLFSLYPEKKLLQSKSLALDFLILQEILFQTAQQKKLALPPQNFLKKKQLKLKRSAANKSWEAKLLAQGLSLDSFWKQVDQYALTDLLISQQVVSKVIISENEVNSYYFNKYGKNLFKDFEYEFSFVSFPNNKKGAEDAQAFLKEAQRNSFAKQSRKKRLVVKHFKLKNFEINPKMYQALKRLSVSQISKPLLIRDQLYLLNLKWKRPFLNPQQQKKIAEVQKHLFETQIKKELKKWIEIQKSFFLVIKNFP